MPTFQSINQPPQGGVPQFVQESPVSSGKAQALGQVASLGADLFSSAATAAHNQKKQEEKTATDTALGGLQQSLLNIRQAGETSNVDVVREQRKALSKFAADFPHLRTEASKMFKAETGDSPAGASLEETAEIKLGNEAISNGYGRHGAPVEHNEEQLELYIQTKRADKQNAARLQELQLRKARGEISKGLVRDEVLGSFREMSGLAYKKTTGDVTNIIASTGDGSMTVEEGQLAIRRHRIEINRAIASLGDYATDASVTAYTQPLLDELQLADDIITGKIERDAAKSIIDTNKARSQAIFFSDPDRVNLVVTSELFGHTAGFAPKMAKRAYGFLTEGLNKEGMVPSRPQPADSTKLTDEEKEGVKGTAQNVVTSDDPKAKKELAAVLAGTAEHLARNGMDYDAEDKQFVIDLLSTPDAMALLNKEQKDAVMMGFDMYVVDDTQVAFDKYINNPKQVTISAPFPRSLGGGAPETRSLVDVADIQVVDGRIFWTVKQQFASNGRIQQEIRQTNRHIQNEITPVVNIYRDGAGIPFEKAVGIFLPQEEEEEQEVKKPSSGELDLSALPKDVDEVFTRRESGDAGADAVNFEVDQFASEGFKPTESTIAEVLAEQGNILKQVDAANAALDPDKGSKSIKQLKAEHGDAYITPTSAVGKFQITKGTLEKAVKRLKLDENTVFTEEVQEEIMTEYLIRTKQSTLKAYFDAEQPSEEQLEAGLKGLGKEWEAFDLVKNPDARDDAILVLQQMHEHFKGENK